MADVAVAKCEDYSPEECRRALLEALEPIGGLDFVKPGMRVAIKANLVIFKKPEAAATTHPALIAELVRLILERGGEAVVGDSPGGIYNSAYVNRVYAASGMRAVTEAGGRLNQDFGQSEAEFAGGEVLKSFHYTSWLDGADAIVDFCKLKSHGMMSMSAAAKNMFGVIPGTMKPEYHYRFPNQRDFAKMLLDLNDYFKPVLSIADAVWGMEGNGPTMGTPRKIGAVLASKSPHMLDIACAEIIGLGAEAVPTLSEAVGRGLIPDSADKLDIAGAPLEELKISDFQFPGQAKIAFKDESKSLGGRAVSGFIRFAMASRPGVEPGLCVGCGECMRICPAKAIKMENSLPKIDRGLCIRCFCCQEFCPKGAMLVRRTAVARALNR